MIRTLLAADPRATVAVRSSASKQVFDKALGLGGPEVSDVRSRVEVTSAVIDTGMVQFDSLRLDEEATRREATLFYDSMGELVSREVDYLRRCGASLVVGDIPPLAFAAAAAAGLPSMAIGNFTWDWIYEDLADSASLVAQVRAAYRHATRALRLPMWGGFADLDPITEDIPFIARQSHRTPAEIRQSIGVPLERKMVLLSFGGFGLADLNVAALAHLNGYTIVTTDLHERERAPGIHVVSEEALYASGLRYEDLVHAADVVVTKPGYGIISEAIANDTALLYTSRGRFREYDVLVREMPRYLRAEFIEQDDLIAGRWGDAIERLLARPVPSAKAALNGAAVAANRILALGAGR